MGVWERGMKRHPNEVRHPQTGSFHGTNLEASDWPLFAVIGPGPSSGEGRWPAGLFFCQQLLCLHSGGKQRSIGLFDKVCLPKLALVG
jgi:hypothetical protein